MLVYRIDILKELKSLGWNPRAMREKGVLGENAIQSIRSGKMVGVKSLDKICRLLNLQPGDVIGYIPDNTSITYNYQSGIIDSERDQLTRKQEQLIELVKVSSSDNVDLMLRLLKKLEV